MTDKRNIKKTTKINNNKKSLNTGKIIKPGKIKNKNIVCVNKKPIDIGKKSFDLLILLISKNKRKTTRKLINKLKNRHKQHKNETQGEILKVSEEINNFHKNPILPLYHPVNRYNQIEYEIKNQINELNKKLHDNGRRLLENRREPTINWTVHNKDGKNFSIELVEFVMGQYITFPYKMTK